MRALRLIGAAISVTAMLSACVSTRPRGCGAASEDASLARLQGIADSTVVALRSVSDTQVTVLRAYLQAVVDRAVTLDRCGRVTTPTELRAAATLGLTARVLGAPAVEPAYRWSRRAVVLDSADRQNWRVMAQAWDQLQVLQRQPQWFGTAIVCAAMPEGRCVLAPLDSTRVSDAQRVELGLRTMAQQRQTVDSMNKARTP